MATNSNRQQTARKGMSAKRRQARKRKKIIIFSVEIFVLIVMLVGLWVVMTVTRNSEEGGPVFTDLEPQNVAISQEVQQNQTMKGYKNIALFGLDAMYDSQIYKGSRSDSIMIASVNMDTGDIKLVSIYRDTLLNLGTDKYEKCTHAYSYGGAEQAVKMLNMNLDMDITDFVAVGYKGLIDVIDGLGGVYIDVDSAELQNVQHTDNGDVYNSINNYQMNIAEKLKCSYNPVTTTGYQKLDGLQATAYCRIRYTSGSDFARAARQREVIKAIEEQAKKTNLSTLTKTFNDASPNIYTSLDSKDILDLLKNIGNYRIVEEGAFPDESMRTVGNIGARGSCVIPLDLKDNVVWLHQFLFEDEEYQVTDSVREYSEKIKSDTAGYIDSRSN